LQGGGEDGGSSSSHASDLIMVLSIRSTTKSFFKKSTESRWTLVAPTVTAKRELQQELLTK
jgi:hypothetical protein